MRNIYLKKKKKIFFNYKLLLRIEIWQENKSRLRLIRKINLKKKKKKKKRETTYLKAKFFKYLEFSIDFLMEIFSCQM